MIADIEENYKTYTFENFDIKSHLVAPSTPSTYTLAKPTVAPSRLPVVTGGGNFDKILENDYELDVDSAIMSTSNQILGTRFFVPRRYVKKYKKLYPEFTIVPNLSEFINEKIASQFDFYDYVNKRINYYTEKGFDLYNDITDQKLEIDSIELVNPISNDEYIKMIGKFKKYFRSTVISFPFAENALCSPIISPLLCKNSIFNCPDS